MNGHSELDYRALILALSVNTVDLIFHFLRKMDNSV